MELNPFETSSAGHRFAGLEYANLAARVLPSNGLPEMRLLELTPPLSAQTSEALPERWRSLLERSGDVYGITEAVFSHDPIPSFFTTETSSDDRVVAAAAHSACNVNVANVEPLL